MCLSSFAQRAIVIAKKRAVSRVTANHQRSIGYATSTAAVSWPAADATKPASLILRRDICSSSAEDKVPHLGKPYGLGDGIQERPQSSHGSSAPSRYKPPMPNWSEWSDLQVLVQECRVAILANNKVTTDEKLRELRQYPGLLEPTVVHKLMLACQSHQGKTEVAKEVISIMRRRKVTPEGSSYIALLVCLCRDGSLHQALTLVQTLARGRDGTYLKPTIIMLNRILAGAFATNQYSVFRKALQFIAYHGLKPNLKTHYHTMLMVGVAKDRTKVRRKWGELLGLFRKQPPILLHSAYVRALADSGALWEARLELEKLKSYVLAKGWEPKRDTGPMQVREMEEEEAASDEVISQRGGGAHQWHNCTKTFCLLKVYDTVLRAGVMAGDLRLVQLLLLERKNLGLQPYAEEFELKMRLRAAANSGNVMMVNSLARIMVSKNLAIDAESRTRWLEAYCRENNLKEASWILLGALYQGRTQNEMFHAMVQACLRLGVYRTAEAAVASMNKAITTGKVRPSDATHAAQYITLGMAMSLEGANMDALLGGITSIRVYASTTTFHSQVWAFGQGGNIDRVMKDMRWAQSATNKDGTPLLNVLIYNSAIQACCRHGKMDEMRELVEMMRAEGLPHDVFSDASLKGQVVYADADLDSALTILTGLVANGTSPDLFIFNFLIQVVSHAGDLAAGMNLLSKMADLGVQPDSMTFRTLLFYADHHRDLNVMESVVEKMHQEGLSPDTDLCLTVIGAYAKHGLYDKAFLELKVLRVRMGASATTLEGEQEVRDDGSAPGVEEVCLQDLPGLNSKLLRTLILRDKRTETLASTL